MNKAISEQAIEPALVADLTNPDTVLDLQSLLESCYENGRYARSIDYRLAPVPPLHGDDRAWADALLTEKKLR